MALGAQRTSVRRHLSWWRHQMDTFSALLVIWAGDSPVTGDFPEQRSVTRSFNVFFDLRLKKRFWDAMRRIETPSRPLWRQSNVCNVSYWNFAFLYSLRFVIRSHEVPRSYLKPFVKWIWPAAQQQCWWETCEMFAPLTHISRFLLTPRDPTVFRLIVMWFVSLGQ